MASSGEKSALVDPEVLGEVAFRRRFAEFRQLASNEIIQVNLDVPRAIARGFGVLPVRPSQSLGTTKEGERLSSARVTPLW